MNLIVVGVSFRTAPVTLLERLAVPAGQTPALLGQLLAQAYVDEAVVLSTCNRVEVYAGVVAFHGGLSDVAAVLAARAGCAPTDLAPHLYVHYGVDAVRHAFRVAAGLDSMVVGEAQILGQLRDAYTLAAEHDAAGRTLHELMQQALRVGKRAHAETGIDRAGQSIVTAALDLAVRELTPPGAEPDAPVTGSGPAGALAGHPAVVVGAGAMGSLALATVHRLGAGPLTVVNRGVERASRLAVNYGARTVPFDELSAVLPGVDLVICATASSGHVLDVDRVAAAGRPLVILDLAVPRDVDPAVSDLPGVVLIDIEQLGEALRTGDEPQRSAASEAAAVEAIVTAEVDGFLSWLRGTEVAPTVAALRARAEELVGQELRRLAQRCPDLTDEQRAEVSHAFHRVVQRLLHAPTVRARQLAAGPGGDRYTVLLRELFDLDVPRPALGDGIPEVDPS
ncbi:MAG TPA: glutamyl-tRNA reductase [Micromonosporaceae bacterium]